MKKNIRPLVFILLFCVFPARVFIHWVPILGYPLVATGIVLIQYICIALLVIHSIIDRNSSRLGRKYKLMFILYWIYNAYLVYYILINPQMPRDMMAQAPENTFGMIQSIIETSLVMAMAAAYQHYLNAKLFIKVAAAFMTFVVFTYALTTDISMYLFEKTLTGTASNNFDISEYGLIDSLTMGEFVSMAFLFNFFARNSWSRKRQVNQVIFWFTSIVLFLLLAIFGQRGPVLWLIVTILFYYFACGKLGKNILVTTAVVGGIVVLFGDALLGLMAKYDITLIERFMSIGDDGGSGRIGSDDSEYTLAFKQIMEGPLFGSYFRTTIGSRVGHYPHNFVLELLMTFGIVFTIPLLWILWHAVKKSYYACRYNEPLAVFCIIFVNVYLCHLTSYTIVNSTNMWVLLAMVLCVRPNHVSISPKSKLSKQKHYGSN